MVLAFCFQLLIISGNQVFRIKYFIDGVGKIGMELITPNWYQNMLYHGIAFLSYVNEHNPIAR